MQSSSSAVPQAEAILLWLQQEMGCSLSQGPSDRTLPSADVLRKICRGNMIPVWKFFLERVKSEKTVERIRKNIHVHGTRQALPDDKAPPRRKVQEGKAAIDKPLGKSGSSKWLDGKGRGRAKEIREPKPDRADPIENRETALREREIAQRDLAKLRQQLERLTKEVKARMLDLTREETDRQRILDDKFSSRRKQIVLEAYSLRCEEAVQILEEYLRRLRPYVDHAHDIQKSNGSLSDATSDSMLAFAEQENGYGPGVHQSVRQSNDQIFLETVQERAVRKVCEAIASNMLERIRTTVPAYNGEGSQGDMQLDLSVAGFEKAALDVARETSLSLLKGPQNLLKVLSQYTARVVHLVEREIDKMDSGNEADQLRGRFEGIQVLDDLSIGTDENGFGFQSRQRPNYKNGLDLTSGSTSKQLRERQKVHVRQFLATEEILTQLAAAKKELDVVNRELEACQSSNGQSGSLQQLQVELWSKELEVSGLKASVGTLSTEVQRLKKKCEERTEAEEILRQKWKRIEEFDARRLELESVYSSFIGANLAARASWEHHPKSAREQAAAKIRPLCITLQHKLSAIRDLVEAEVVHFRKVPESRVCALPISEEALTDYMRGTVAAGVDVTEAASLVAARVGAGDPSAIPSICRISAALRTSAGSEASDAGLATVVEAVRVFLQGGAQSANLLEDLAGSVYRVQVLQDIISNGQAVLTSANLSRPEYQRIISACLATAKAQEKTAAEWLVELKSAVQKAQSSLEDCRRVRGLVDEWWEQPASQAVKWITVDGQNVAAWLAHVKQLQTAFYEKQLV